MFQMPKVFFLVSGKGDASTELNAFDAALLDAGVGNTNLVKMSSIVPPHCKEVKPFKLPYGALVPVAYASITSSNPGETIAAAVAIAVPEDENMASLVMEYECVGTKEEAEKTVRQMAVEGMEKIRGQKIKELKSIAVEHKVEDVGAVFAAVVLWDKEGE